MSEMPEIQSDQLLGFTLPARHARGRMVQLDQVLDRILSAHDYPAPVAHLLAEALVLCALMGGLLKDRDAQMTMQAQTEGGPVRLLVCDYRGGEMRGYVDFDAARLAELGANPTLFALFGKGYLAITFDPVKGQRYQGIVPLEGSSLAETCERYFNQSEQIPSLLRVAVRMEGGRCLAGGMLLQHFPEGEEGRERLHVQAENPDWEHIAILGGTVSHEELLDPALTMQAIIWHLFHEEEEVRVWPGDCLSRGCRCTVEHYQSVLERFPEGERADMRDDNGDIVIDCAFCSKQFKLAI